AWSDRTYAGDIDNGTTSGIHHALANQCGQAEGPLEIQIEDAVIKPFADVDRSIIKGGLAGVVDQHVYSAKLLVCRGRQVLALLPPSYMASVAHCPAAALAYCATHLLAGRNSSARDHQIGARIGEAERHGAAETSAAPSDENHLSGQIDDVLLVHPVAES